MFTRMEIFGKNCGLRNLFFLKNPFCKIYKNEVDISKLKKDIFKNALFRHIKFIKVNILK